MTTPPDDNTANLQSRCSTRRGRPERSLQVETECLSIGRSLLGQSARGNLPARYRQDAVAVAQQDEGDCGYDNSLGIKGTTHYGGDHVGPLSSGGGLTYSRSSPSQTSTLLVVVLKCS